MTHAREPAGGGDLRATLASGGPVARALLDVDWDATPLGPPERWPQSLASTVRTMLDSRFSMWLGWGPDLIFFCNDAYRRDTLGTKFPWALGRPAGEVWAEIWDEIAPIAEKVMGTGEASWHEALLLLLERSGYVEESYHTFSYSPLAGDDGSIAGMLCVVTEETERVIAERRMSVLRDLGQPSAAPQDESRVVAEVARHLAVQPRSLPFTLTYLFDGDRARLAASSGMPEGHPAAPSLIDLADPDAAWPVARLAAGEEAVVEDLPDRFPALPTGAWTRPPQQALVVPLPQPEEERPYGFLVVGLNRYRPLDERYRGFVRLIAGQIAARVAVARAYQRQRRRAEELAELDRAKTIFFTNVSHEFRTPLTLMLGPGQDALADSAHPLAPEQRERVEVMQRNGLRMLKLVNSLLDFSRLESGRVQARFEPVDLARLTVDLVAMFEPAAARAGLDLVVDCPPLGHPVHVDREMWSKIVFNLLSNALKFTFTGGIGVRLRERDGVAELAVTDTGVGIDPAELGRLFERFHRVTGARARSHEGSGIGLALVAELAALHGGSATVDSEPGAGSTFTVTVRTGTAHLPADQIVTADAAPADTRQADGYLGEAMRWLAEERRPDAEGGGPVRAQGGRPYLLVVEDNADMRRYLVSLLDDAYEVATAPDGATALRMARRRCPDLVLTDVMMPELDGFGLLAALREDPTTALVPVVMLSARAGPESTVEGLSAGADDYLVKPFSAPELLARVRANLELDRTRRARTALERSRALLDQAQRLAGVGSWEVDLASGLVTVSDEFARQAGMGVAEIATRPYAPELLAQVHPRDVGPLREALAAATDGAPLDREVRVLGPDGSQRLFRLIGERECGPDGATVRLRGSTQDITEQRAAERAVAAAAAAREAAVREHRIADELQRSLLPARRFDPDHLRVATYYRAGERDTQVGGDWYDVIELGADRTALVMGDVMGRGVRAAAVMGQVRAAIRAYSRLDLPPADVLEFLDGVVRDLGNQIVTCVYAVYDPGERRLTFASAGHLPPLLVEPDGTVRRLTGVNGPPLGAGPFTLTEAVVQMRPGATLAVYTDGLVERRDQDIDMGISTLVAHLSALDATLTDGPAALVAAMDPDLRDDIAVLLARVTGDADAARSAMWDVPSQERAVQDARAYVVDVLRGWRTPEHLVDDIVLLVSELVTNAVLHGRPPIQLRLRASTAHIVVEVHDRAPFMPRKQRPTPEDEHGRGLQLVALLADRWGTRPTAGGKAVWCVFGMPRG